jgi:hypothetical protein
MPRYLDFLTHGNATGKPYVDLQLRPAELQAIGKVTTLWAFLEFLILRETKGLAEYLERPLPTDAEAVSFRKRRKVWEDLSRDALANLDEELRRALDCIERTDRLANERHRLTHSIIEYDKTDPNRLKAYPRSDFGKVGWPLSAAAIEKTALGIARLSHDVLSIHADPRPLPGASPRKQDKQDRYGSSPTDGVQ